MIGTIIGDIVGSVYEFSNYKPEDYLRDVLFFVKLDEQAWKACLAENEDIINPFVDEAIERCVTQAIIMQDAQGYAALRSS